MKWQSRHWLLRQPRSSPLDEILDFGGLQHCLTKLGIKQRLIYSLSISVLNSLKYFYKLFSITSMLTLYAVWVHYFIDRQLPKKLCHLRCHMRS